MSLERIKYLHGQYKAAVIDGRKSPADRIAGTLYLAGGNRNYHITRPHDKDAFMLVVHTNFDDYSDPIPAIKEMDAMIESLQQLKYTFTKVWTEHIEKHLNGGAKVTLEEEQDEVKRNSFAKIAVPMFNELWKMQFMAPGMKLKAFGVTHQDLAELHNAAKIERYQLDVISGRSMLTFKGIPIIPDDRAKYREAVPIYVYGDKQLISNFNFKPDPIGQLVLEDTEPVQQQQYCGEGDHSKVCRCHLGWRIKR